LSEETQAEKPHEHGDIIVFKIFSVRRLSEKQAFSNTSGLKSAFEKLRFGDGLM